MAPSRSNVVMPSLAKIFAAPVSLILLVGLASVRGAESGPAPFEIATEDTVVRFEVGAAAPRIVSIQTAIGPNWVAASPETPLPTVVVIGDKEQRVHWSFVGEAQQDRSVSFTYESADPALKAVSTWSAVNGPGPVEHAVTLTNGSDATITFQFPATISLALKTEPNFKLEHWWVNKGAGYPEEKGGTYSEVIDADYSKTQYSGPYSEDWENRDAIPWFAIQNVDANCGIYGGIEFSGWTEIKVVRADDGEIALTMGMQVRDGIGNDKAGRTQLKPAGTYHYPTCFVGAYQGDVDDGCNRLHRWVETHLRPPMPWGVTPVLVNNSWGSGMAVDEALARKMIDDCVALGIEHFQVDAGWYRELGNWYAHPDKFPNGIDKIADYAHSQGLKFGMWVGWTQAGATQGDDPKILSVFNPAQREWFGRDMPADWKNQEFIGEPVCLGSADASAWCLEELRRMVKDYKLDLLEHDQDMMLDNCSREGHGHIPGDPVDTSRATAEGYYKIYDQLRKENPHLLFEDCVNGGRLVDFGVVKRVHYICVTDIYDPLACRRAFYDASYPLPPSMVELYLENVPGDTLESFASMLRSATLGWATIMIDTSQWSPEHKEIAKREFKIYKEKLRPLIAAANLYHILPRPAGNRWDGVQYHDSATESGVVYVFRAHADEDAQTVKLRGLSPTKRYQIDSVDGSSASATRTGQELMEKGLALRIAEDDGSDLVFLSPAK
jgi:alpha-galactosidase